MTAFAQTLQRQQQEAAAIQTSERTKRRVVRRSPVVVEPSEPAESPDDVFDDRFEDVHAGIEALLIEKAEGIADGGLVHVESLFQDVLQAFPP